MTRPTTYELFLNIVGSKEGAPGGRIYMGGLSWTFLVTRPTLAAAVAFLELLVQYQHKCIPCYRNKTQHIKW